MTKRIADLEAELKGAGEIGISQLLAQSDITHELLGSAYLLKKAAGQINVMIHAIGILLVLPQILRPGESISYLSLGAGNTGKRFDLETDYRVAEFNFIHWRGVPKPFGRTRCSRTSICSRNIKHPSVSSCTYSAENIPCDS